MIEKISRSLTPSSAAKKSTRVKAEKASPVKNMTPTFHEICNDGRLLTVEIFFCKVLNKKIRGGGLANNALEAVRKLVAPERPAPLVSVGAKRRELGVVHGPSKFAGSLLQP